ncbi:alpha/beta hydrolase [Sphingobium sp.]|uniref:alpha/beta hydrolase n=1 Tax=Sphingobium sp. TaxID=1912891 RepID=UPI0028BE0AD9|nr:alpha/beta hydrolase [Sphingobium sp.]
MPIDPVIQAMMDSLAAAGVPPIHSLSVDKARAQVRALEGVAAGAPPDVASIHDFSIPSSNGAIPARLFRPAGPSAGVIVYFHAGGWVLGDLESAALQLYWLVHATRCALLSVAYRLAPEHRFPAAVDDACAALTWAAENKAVLAGSDVPLIVAGESAGANLAAVACIDARDRGKSNVALQVLLYPVTDSDLTRSSYEEFAAGYLLERSTMAWFWNHYAPDARARSDPRAAPILASNFAGLPPAFIQTAECDPLRDEGEAFGAKLRQAGVDVRAQRRTGLIHGYASFVTVSPAATAAMQDVADAITDCVLSQRS